MSYWSRLGISRKFSHVFSLLFGLISLMAMIIGISIIYIQNAEDDIRQSSEIGHQVLMMDRGLEHSRRLLGDFFLNYNSLGLQKAHVQYAQPSVRQISKVISLSSDLEKTLFPSDLKDKSFINQVDINIYLASAKRFADTSIVAVELISKRAAPAWGLESKIHYISYELEKSLSQHPTLLQQHVKASVFYKDYLLHRQRSLLQSVFNIHSTIVSDLQKSTDIARDRVAQLIGLLTQFRSLADELLILDFEIQAKMNDFSIQETVLAPISVALIKASQLEVKTSQQNIDTIYQTAGIIIAMITILALLVMFFIANLLHHTITLNIVRLTTSADEFGQGNLDIQLRENSQDELGQLTRIFNQMAAKLKGLIENLENKVSQRTSELAESEARFRNLMDDLPQIAVQGYDRERRITYWNKTCESLYGFTKSEVMGCRIEELLPPEATENTIVNGLTQWFENGSPLSPSERTFRHKDGSVVPIYSAQVMMNTGDGDKMIYSVDLDLSDLKLALAMEQRIESFYLQLFNHSSSGVTVYQPLDDNDFLIKSINPAGLQICKATYENVIGRKLTEVFPGVVDMGLLDVLRRVLSTGIPQSLLARAYQDTERHFWSDNHIYKLPTGEVVAVYDDISQRKLAEDHLIRKTEEWEKTFDAIPDLITLQDENMRIIKANRATFDYFQMEPEALLGATCHSLFRGTTEPCEDCSLNDPKKDCSSNMLVIKHQYLDKTFHISLTPVPGIAEDSGYFVHVAKDITEQQRLEEQVAQSLKIEAIGSLAGGIAHDFNNILMAIIGYAELAENSIPANHPAKSDLREILISAARAADLVEQILTYSRKKEHRYLRVNPFNIVKEALRLLKPSLPATIEIVEQLDVNCGDILADPTNIHQIVINLCTNAFHAMEDQKGTITIRLYRDDISSIDDHERQEVGTPVSSVILSVTDTGVGMDQRTIDRIFDPYFTTKAVGKGSGMGLAVVQGIVKGIKGVVEVSSSPGKGTTLRISIPRLRGDSLQREIINKSILPTPPASLPQVKKIFVVDDEPLLVKLHKRQLERHGYIVDTETSSEKALLRFSEAPDQFDLLITDQTMPRLSGAELSKAILQIRPDLPIIMCTGHSDIVSAEDAISLGIKKYVIKPIQSNKLLQAVEEAIGTTPVTTPP
ncbi:MAG: PAS domain S-box-containing protein [Desulforhopalus sp.]|jgi:PAS domain S-box-containing protein